MTDTTTYPLSTTLSAVLRSDQGTENMVSRDIVAALADAGAVDRDRFAEAHDAVLHAIGVMVEHELDLRGGLSGDTARLVADMAVNALRSHGLLLDSTT